ncbi:unnamed protein product [Fraxinus pennsylvanica]|uniref:Beta-glucosidase n=1 Tax=Fraxinus pennsylvanica TaxID=56036 RepID=A0AAD1YP12_9LAMI|nr:unnamed protein product [Fraxinus pennsylvanica]
MTDGADALDYPFGSDASKFTEMKIKRSDFPSDFIFGSGVSAYQVEGAWAAGGKGLSNWDVFTQRAPGYIENGSNGCVAIDQYNLWKEDVALLKKVGFNSYRFSISWTRVLPGGKLSAGINRDGIKYYNDLIDLLVAKGIKPCATIFHWDTPQILEDQYGGFLSPRIVKDYCEFAELCFWEFGDRVKHWVTLNEPWSYTVQGYVLGTWPPARGATTSTPVTSIPRHRSRRGARSISTAGNPGTEPYTVAHHLILSHAAAVDIYRQRYQAHQGGKIGMTNVSQWFEPLADTKEDIEAASRAIDFMFGCAPPPSPSAKPSYETDQQVTLSGERDGIPIGPQAGSDWLYVVPIGIYKLLIYIKAKYDNPSIFITENGVDEVNNTAITVSEARFDEKRITYHQEHLYYIKQAMEEGVDVNAYYIWAMFDNFEWSSAYTVRFGIFYVDFVNGRLTRIPKMSAIWFMNLLDEKPNLLKIQAQANEGENASVKRIRSR